MTRDEAINVVKNTIEVVQDKTADQLVSALEKLGVLKLEEPLSLTDKIHRAMCDEGYAFLRSDDFKRSMEKHGLKIVEK